MSLPLPRVSSPSSTSAPSTARTAFTHMAVELELEDEEDSPYAEVRASVSNLDDTTLPVVTFRSVILGLCLSAVVSVVNTLLSQRNPPIQIVPIVVQILVHPLGKLLAKVLPFRTFRIGKIAWSFNPGLWNIKEHTVVLIAASTSINPSYTLSILFAQDLKVFWDEQRPYLYGLLFVCAPQLVGLAFSGFARKALVEPASMIWPQNLVVSTVLNALHAEEDVGTGRALSQFRFFALISLAAMLFYVLPGYLFQALSAFNWVCWIWPKNVPVNIVFGVVTGLGASLVTFDWTQVIYVGSPLITPWWAQVNLFSGFVAGLWIVAPALYFSNVWGTAYLPMLSGASFDRFGSFYNVTRVSPDHRSFDQTAYEGYSPVYISAGLVMAYFGGFALITAAIVHTALYHGGLVFDIVRGRSTPDDVHARLMKKYTTVPLRCILAVGLSMSLVLAAGYHTSLPVLAVLLALLIPAVYMLPFGFIFAMSGLPAGVNLLSEVMVSYLLPGKPMPVMMFKTLSQQTMTSGLDQKLGHYMKIPPRAIFWIQSTSIIINSFIQVAAKNFMRDHINGLCMPNQEDKFTCPATRIFYTASVIWGVIGAERTFGAGARYHSLWYGLVVGAAVPLCSWLHWKTASLVSSPIFMAPPASGVNFTSAFVYLLRQRCTNWWARYNYVLAGAMDFGTIFSSLAIYLLPDRGDLQVHWWGNEVFTRTADFSGTPLLQVPKNGI
ncbi:LOW QUALITY PROTEIN: OPT oligopeptide transporter [Testicularia cyperi]|uniref:OPT oligopeptide transporter n=1 Tax=Testicularia cyperi TaxID=1882483 RepID=A0A317XT64_9BASI|nr:LOW QUALITY PROTEIN: OPT oligopeptide transporter [Testicularia cyperi]